MAHFKEIVIIAMIGCLSELHTATETCPEPSIRFEGSEGRPETRVTVYGSQDLDLALTVYPGCNDVGMLTFSWNVINNDTGQTVMAVEQNRKFSIKANTLEYGSYDVRVTLKHQARPGESLAQAVEYIEVTKMPAQLQLVGGAFRTLGIQDDVILKVKNNDPNSEMKVSWKFSKGGEKPVDLMDLSTLRVTAKTLNGKSFDIKTIKTAIHALSLRGTILPTLSRLNNAVFNIINSSLTGLLSDLGLLLTPEQLLQITNELTTLLQFYQLNLTTITSDVTTLLAQSIAKVLNINVTFDALSTAVSSIITGDTLNGLQVTFGGKLGDTLNSANVSLGNTIDTVVGTVDNLLSPSNASLVGGAIDTVVGAADSLLSTSNTSLVGGAIDTVVGAADSLLSTSNASLVGGAVDTVIGTADSVLSTSNDSLVGGVINTVSGAGDSLLSTSNESLVGGAINTVVGAADSLLSTSNDSLVGGAIDTVVGAADSLLSTSNASLVGGAIDTVVGVADSLLSTSNDSLVGGTINTVVGAADSVLSPSNDSLVGSAINTVVNAGDSLVSTSNDSVVGAAVDTVVGTVDSVLSPSNVSLVGGTNDTVVGAVDSLLSTSNDSLVGSAINTVIGAGDTVLSTTNSSLVEGGGVIGSLVGRRKRNIKKLATKGKLREKRGLLGTITNTTLGTTDTLLQVSGSTLDSILNNTLQGDLTGLVGDILNESLSTVADLLNTTADALQVDNITNLIESISEVAFLNGTLGIGDVLVMLDATVNGVINTITQIINIVDSLAMPSASIVCLKNCLTKVTITNPVAFMVLTDLNILSSYEVKWKLQKVTGSVKKRALFSTSTAVYTDVSLLNATTTGTTSNYLSISAYILEPGMEYLLKVYVTKDNVTGTSIYYFLTNLPPYGGNCGMIPTRGVTTVTQFTLSCSGWLDEGDFPTRDPDRDRNNTIIFRYTYLQRAKGSDETIVIYRGLSSFLLPSSLVPGIREHGYAVDVFMRIADSYGDEAEIIVPSEILQPDFTTGELLALSDVTNNVLAPLFALGNEYGVLQMTSSLVEVLNDDESQMDVCGTSSIESYFKRKSLVQETLVSDIQTTVSSSMLTSTGSVWQTATSLRKATRDWVRLTNKSALIVTDTCSQLADLATKTFLTTLNETTAIGQDVFESLVHVVLATVPETLTAVYQQEFGDIDPWTEAELLAAARQTASAALQQARSIAKHVVDGMESTMSVISSWLESQLVVGETPVVFDSPLVQMKLQKLLNHQIYNLSMPVRGGSIWFPNRDSFLLNGISDDSLLYLETTSMNEVLHTWDDSATRVKTGVIGITLKDGVGHEYSVKGLKHNVQLFFELKDTSVYQESLNLLSSNTRHYTNVTARTRVYNISCLYGEDTLLMILKSPNSITHFDLYFKYDEYVNETYYDAQVTITWKNNVNVNQMKHFMDCPRTKYATVLFIAYEGNERTVNYGMDVHEVSCLYWNNASNIWTSDGCTVGEETTLTQVQCLASHLTYFAADFMVPPNTIDFSTIFSRVASELADNFTVLATLVGILALYFTMAMALRHADRADVFMWRQRYLSSNDPCDTFVYHITVCTGGKAWAGTKSRVYLELHGDRWHTAAKALNDHDEFVFSTGSERNFVLTSSEDIGTVQYISVWHDNSGKRRHQSWFLSHIIIKDITRQQSYVFICNQWLAIDKDDGRIHRLLNAATEADLKDFSHLFNLTWQHELSDGHIWASLFWRSSRSNFTRVQRLSCCLCILFTSMIANAMFYGTLDGVKSNPIKIGPFIFGLAELWVATITNLIVFPVNFIIIEIFRRRGSWEEWDNRKLDVQNGKNPPLILPPWASLLAWFLLLAAVFISGFFTFLYSIQWGKAKAEGWLTTMLLGFLESIWLVQPLKALVLAALVAMVFKKSRLEKEVTLTQVSQETDYEPDKVVVLRSNLHWTAPAAPPDSVNLAEQRERRQREREIEVTIYFIVTYVLYIILLLLLVYSTVNNTDYQHTKVIKDAFVSADGGFSDIASIGDFWTWAQGPLLSSLYRTKYYNGEKLPWSQQSSESLEGHYIRIGTPIFRQLRVRPDLCDVAGPMKKWMKECNVGYSHGNEQRPKFFSHTYNSTKINDISPYQTMSQLSGLPYMGQMTSYDGGGFVAKLGRSYREASEKIQALLEYQWIDQYTRAVFVEFPLYNVDANMFSVVMLLTEQDRSTLIKTSFYVSSLKLYIHYFSSDVLLLICHVIFVIWVIYDVIKHIKNVRKQRKAYFDDVWNIVSVLVTGASVVLVFLYIGKLLIAQVVVGKKLSEHTEFHNMYRIVLYDQIIHYLLGFIVFVATMRIYKLLEFNTRMHYLAYTLSVAARDLPGYAFFFGVVTVAFALFGLSAFGAIVEEYHTFITVVQTQLLMSLGGVMSGDVEDRELRIMIRIYYVMYVTSTMWIVLNLMVTIITEAFSSSREELAGRENKYEAVQYVTYRIREILGLSTINKKGNASL